MNLGLIVIVSVILIVSVDHSYSQDHSEEALQQVMEKFNTASHLFQQGKFRQSEKIWRELVAVIPQLAEPWENLGVTLEQQGKKGEAMNTYEQAVLDDRLDESLKPYRHLCTIIVQSLQEAMKRSSNLASGLRDVGMKYCQKGIDVHPDDIRIRQTFGVMLIEILDFEKAFEHLEKAVELDPLSAETRLYLATAYSRAGFQYHDEAILHSEMTIELKPNAHNYHNLAILLSVSEFRDPRTLHAYQTATELIGKEVKTKECPKGFSVVSGWHQFLNGDIDESKYDISVSLIEQGSTEVFGEAHPHTLDTTHVDDMVRTQFKEHDIVLVKAKDIYLNGPSGIWWKDCSVFTGSHQFASRVVDDFKGRKGSIKYIKDPVAVLIQLNQKNYYHFMVETMSRLIYLKDMETEIPNLKYLCPKAQQRWFKEMFDLLGIPEKKIIWHDSYKADGCFIQEAYWVDWLWTEDNDIQSDDLSRMYYPPRQALHRLRDYMKSFGEEIKEEDKKILYISRTDASARKIDSTDEAQLVSRIFRHTGADNFELVVASQLSFISQIKTFQGAKVIVGPHGAGLTNMMWADPGTVVIQLPMKPNSDNCFGYLASAMGHEHWIIPEISSYYYGNYPALDKRSLDLLEQVLDVTIGDIFTQKERTEEGKEDL